MLRRHPREYDARSRALIILYFNRRYIRWKSKLRRIRTRATLPPSDKLGFGHYFTDHMFVMNYSDAEGWHDARIVPYGPISLSPAASVFHYGTEVFEGLKAYRTPDGGVQLFRPWDNMARLTSPATVSACPASTPMRRSRASAPLSSSIRTGFPRSRYEPVYPPVPVLHRSGSGAARRA